MEQNSKEIKLLKRETISKENEHRILSTLKDCLKGTDLQPNTPIFKILPLKFLLPILENQQFLIGKVNEWEDVYENFLFKQPLSYKGQDADWLSYSDCIYGQSWTLERSSDAMWRIYSVKPNTEIEIPNTAIRVESTIEKLWKQVMLSDICLADTKILPVKYTDDVTLSKWLNSHSKIDFSSLEDTIFESLSIKRKPFKHEKKIRLIKLDEHNSTNVSHKRFISFPIFASELFLEFVMDPRITDDELKNQIQSLIKSFGSDIPIRQSSLYKFQHSTRIQIL